LAFGESASQQRLVTAPSFEFEFEFEFEDEDKDDVVSCRAER
jgi:hypothetical protein